MPSTPFSLSCLGLLARWRLLLVQAPLLSLLQSRSQAARAESSGTLMYLSRHRGQRCATSAQSFEKRVDVVPPSVKRGVLRSIPRTSAAGSDQRRVAGRRSSCGSAPLMR